MAALVALADLAAFSCLRHLLHPGADRPAKGLLLAEGHRHGLARHRHLRLVNQRNRQTVDGGGCYGSPCWMRPAYHVSAINWAAGCSG